jgi:hypothetical protein
LYNFLKKIYRTIFGAYGLPSLLSKEIDNDWTILDAGCGRTSALQGVNKGSYSVGLDFYKPYLIKIRGLSAHNACVLGDVRALPFKSNSFDCVVATEILEHLSKLDGLKMLAEIERVAKKKILMTTPNGFLPTYAGPDDNSDETHLCGYDVSELVNLGFRVYGFHGLKVCWTVQQGQAVIRYRPKWLFTLLMEITWLFAFYHPSKAFQFFIIKNIRD